MQFNLVNERKKNYAKRCSDENTVVVNERQAEVKISNGRKNWFRKLDQRWIKTATENCENKLFYETMYVCPKVLVNSNQFF